MKEAVKPSKEKPINTTLMRVKYIFLFLAMSSPIPVFAKSYIGPFLEKPHKNEYLVAYEGNIPSDAYVIFENLFNGKRKKAKLFTVVSHRNGLKTRRLKKASLRNYASDTLYSYRLVHRRKKGREYFFQTDNRSESQFSFLAMSDAQHGYKVTTRNILDTVIPHAIENEGDYPIRFGIFAGDLVQHGSKYKLWKKQYFDPMQPLLSKIPVMPALGNHEEDDKLYFSYFDLPTNGSPKSPEHWYYFDYSNIRMIALDTNKGYRTKEQLHWLENVLQEAKANDRIDFVLAFFHHPHQSELWLKGGIEYSGKIEKALVNFTRRSSKPSLYFCGHTHGYSRGHNLKSNHTMLIIGSIGGAIDDWGDEEQKDYLYYVKTLDEFGWVRAYVDTGPNARIVFERHSFGDDKKQKYMGVVDRWVMKKKNKLPGRPRIVKKKVTTKKVYLKLSRFQDTDGDEHLTTHYQLSTNPKFIAAKNYYKQMTNIYWDKDKVKKFHPRFLKFKKSRFKYFRVRFRDSALGYSRWSKVLKF
ncbi:MAG: metallophosphoesterase [Spirochaetota bacterium]